MMRWSQWRPGRKIRMSRPADASPPAPVPTQARQSPVEPPQPAKPTMNLLIDERKGR